MDGMKQQKNKKVGGGQGYGHLGNGNKNKAVGQTGSLSCCCRKRCQAKLVSQPASQSATRECS